MQHFIPRKQQFNPKKSRIDPTPERVNGVLDVIMEKKEIGDFDLHKKMGWGIGVHERIMRTVKIECFAFWYRHSISMYNQQEKHLA